MEKKKKKGKTLKTVLLVIVAGCLIGALFGQKKESPIDEPVSASGNTMQESKADNETTPTSEKEDNQSSDIDAYGWTEDDYITFMTITQQISDEYVANYSSPWGVKDWNFVKFDDNGKVAVTTKYTFDNMNEKQSVLCIFTLNGDEFSGHFLSIGNEIYLNDGSCDETLNKIAELS